MIKQKYILIIITIIFLITMSVLLYNLNNNNIEGFSKTRDKAKNKLRLVHRHIKKKTNEAYTNAFVSFNRAVRKMKF